MTGYLLLSMAVIILAVAAVVWSIVYAKRHSRNELDALVANVRIEMEGYKQEAKEIRKGIREEAEQTLLHIKESEKRVKQTKSASLLRKESLNEEIWLLHKQGKTEDEIARMQKRNKGEIQVILSYYESKENKKVTNGVV